jgi:F-type H+-transporting ATPase subunit b
MRADTPGLFNMDFQELLPTIAKLVNLLLFVGLMVYFLRRPIMGAFRGRQESIRTELRRAEEERAAAEARLAEVEGRNARLDAEVETIRANAQKEAAEERARVERATEAEIRKIRDRARREVESAGKAARAELRTFTAEQSVKLAEEMIRRDIRPEDDAHLAREYVEELGGVRR